MRKLLLAFLVCLVSCELPKPEKATYEVIGKEKEVDSHYNFFTEKQVVETVRVMVVKNVKTGNIITIHPSENLYYRFKVGDKFITTKYTNDYD